MTALASIENPLTNRVLFEQLAIQLVAEDGTGSFGKLHRVGHRQQMLHFVQLFVNVDESALLQADTIQKYVRIQARPPFCSS